MYRCWFVIASLEKMIIEMQETFKKKRDMPNNRPHHTSASRTSLIRPVDFI